MATAPDRLRRARPLLGTFVEIAVAHAVPEVMAAAVECAFDAIDRIHRCMSFHDPASDVSRLNQHAAAGAVMVDPWTFQVLETAVELYRRSAGLFRSEERRVGKGCRLEVGREAYSERQ